MTEVEGENNKNVWRRQKKKRKEWRQNYCLFFPYLYFSENRHSTRTDFFLMTWVWEGWRVLILYCRFVKVR